MLAVVCAAVGSSAPVCGHRSGTGGPTGVPGGRRGGGTDEMRPPLHTRAMRALVAAGLALSPLRPGASLIGAAEGVLVLKAGTDQKTETLNPWAATTVV